MVPRRIHERHRASTPLELLVDLVFVVAISRAVTGLVHEVAAGSIGTGLVTFAMVFFSIWWAWMNFTWFASSYDVDDGPYRLLVMVQMGGVLILAAGVDRAAADIDLTTITLAYVVMRVALVAQWIRAGRSDPDGRPTVRRYAIAIPLVQGGWLARLALPHDQGWAVGSFIILAAVEMAIPVWAESRRRTSWHPHHIAERYGLFTIILLGESVLAAVSGVREQIDTSRMVWPLIIVSGSGLVLLFALWWIYFLDPMADRLARNRELQFTWGYGHVVIFVALAIMGAGLDLAVDLAADAGGSAGQVGATADAVAGASPVGPVQAGYFLAAGVWLFLVGIWALVCASLHRWTGWLLLALASLVLAAAPWIGRTAAGIVGVSLAITGVAVAVAAWLIFTRHRRAGR